MSWLALLSSFLTLAKMLLGQAAQRQERRTAENGMSIGRMAALKEVLDESVNLMAEAEAARRAFRDDLRQRPDSLSDDDGFKRRPRPTGATDAKP